MPQQPPLPPQPAAVAGEGAVAADDAVAGDEDGDAVIAVGTREGSRYSFGYPACPDMSDQETLFRLLDPTRIGCELTDNWQIVPEQSTSAIVVHHPEAKYFGV